MAAVCPRDRANCALNFHLKQLRTAGKQLLTFPGSCSTLVLLSSTLLNSVQYASVALQAAERAPAAIR